jgi:murein DD-endopeptidase MepM/ murein hydrolase activator NlpD
LLFEKEMPRKDIFSGSDTKEMPIEIPVEPKKIGLSDGEAVLRISVRDYSWRDWWHGNIAYLEKTISVDTKPAQIEVLSNAHNVAQGGSGLIVYRLSEECPSSGVTVGENFFPGIPGNFQDPLVYLCFFALRHDQGPGTGLSLTAVDVAGNRSKAGFYSHIQKKRFKTDTISITDGFLDRKMPEFDVVDAGGETLSPVEQFLKVNGVVRKENFETILEIISRSDPVLYWQGKFDRLSGSATRATFAEARDYIYSGKKIDHQTHLGIDLASVANAPVPAANAGRVAFAGRIGIYGNTVIIDHGFGLFSLYSHLSSMSVTEEQILDKGNIIGRTGTTGMAGGDHLHFSILVHNTFVNPIEWWDGVWIENNITSKLAGIEDRTL